jgi:hypothetical protein
MYLSSRAYQKFVAKNDQIVVNLFIATFGAKYSRLTMPTIVFALIKTQAY